MCLQKLKIQSNISFSKMEETNIQLLTAFLSLQKSRRLLSAHRDAFHHQIIRDAGFNNLEISHQKAVSEYVECSLSEMYPHECLQVAINNPESVQISFQLGENDHHESFSLPANLHLVPLCRIDSCGHHS